MPRAAFLLGRSAAPALRVRPDRVVGLDHHDRALDRVVLNHVAHAALVDPDRPLARALDHVLADDVLLVDALARRALVPPAPDADVAAGDAVLLDRVARGVVEHDAPLDVAQLVAGDVEALHEVVEVDGLVADALEAAVLDRAVLVVVERHRAAVPVAEATAAHDDPLPRRAEALLLEAEGRAGPDRAALRVAGHRDRRRAPALEGQALDRRAALLVEPQELVRIAHAALGRHRDRERLGQHEVLALDARHGPQLERLQAFLRAVVEGLRPERRQDLHARVGRELVRAGEHELARTRRGALGRQDRRGQREDRALLAA